MHLVPGHRYIVVKEFADNDGDVHPVGEEWTFLKHSFLPYHDGLTLFISRDGSTEDWIRLWWTKEGQAHIIDDLSTYIQQKP